MNSFKGFCAMPNAVVLQCFGSVEGSTRFFSSTEQSVNIQREVTTPNGLVTVLRDSDSSCQDLPIVLNAVYTKEFESSSSSAQRKRRSVIITTDTCTLEPTTTKCVLLDAAVTAEASNPDPAVPYTTASEKPCEQQKSCTAVKTMFTTYFGADVASFKEPTTVNGIIYYYTALSSLLFPIDTSTTSDVMNMFKGTYYTVQQTLCEKALGETNGANTLATSSSPMNTDCTLFDVDSGNGWRNLHNVAQFQLDQSLFSAIKQGWACTNFLSCSDVMMASIKIKAFENFGAARKLEIFAGENLSSDVDLVTDVFIVSLFGTVQGSSTFNISQSEKPFFLLLPIIGSPTDVVMCHRYDTVMNKWTMDGCQTMSANNKNVTCSCQQYGPMAAFEMPPSFQLSTTTTASTNAQTTMTTASNSSSNATKATTTVDPATISRFESFKIILDENFQEFVAKFANISNATEHLCNQFKNLTGIQFHNCSISDQGNIGLIVFFTGNQSVINQTTTSLLQQANDGIDLKDANGVTLMILSISVGDDSPIVPGNPPPKEDEDNDHITVIVVVVVILTLGLIIIAVIVCFMNQNASSSSKISPSPNGSKVALRETASFQDPIHGNDDVRDENC